MTSDMRVNVLGDCVKMTSNNDISYEGQRAEGLC